ncbi:cysteine desulfurase [Roseobacter sp. HKCCD9010]|uniref:urate hydroxylase PuuD n=1 Tax=unclassified Roseobacter TaxID=196798 RepID=UPI0014930974|nr:MULTISPECIES: urate hydroxylase PuuD [unclassified Roseobacter]MBF9050297.1 cysteine desulfurase [Rhodobacterales bacterium HKCCD4356]NNV12540.1 cysteine desulfurase [Roseobacter sp. HKCCD7357]NNV15995.1 cysteine desulfurase [Roseobacter sp. HKCCD8768]NNV25455.1 cysteine desulfurase [Roseobacter sp. HKCCD8192]NNV29712.1 cysteine desulfurase [Roseobacter sp. HKCCD9061]
MDQTILLHWAEFAVRWLHVITVIAWIGSSFYFIALDLGLRRDPKPASGADGDEWQVHGGGFYHIQKYMVAPAEMPEHLVWFKWESYATWLSGVALLALVYWMGAELYLIDYNVMELVTWQAVLISAGSLVIGWVIYDALCKSPLGDNPTVLMLLLFIMLVIMSWGYTQVFSGRAALLHLGAFTATIMTANVAMIIIPNQKIVVADLKAGRTPDAKYGKIAKLRSTHNNYLTLPIIFLMLSNHYPLAFASEYNWVIASLVFLMGVTIRHFFNTMHAKGGMLWWTWGATALIFAVIVWLSVLPLNRDPPIEEARLSPLAERFAAHEDFPDIANTVLGRCSMCHAQEVFWPGIAVAPRGVHLETDAEIASQARAIYLQAGVTHAMPPGNLSFMEESERAAIRAWYREVTGGAL